MRWLLTVALIIAAVPAFTAAPPIADLRVEQSITEQDHRFTAAPAVNISFTLGAKAEVTVTVRRHLPGMRQFQGAYLVEPPAVRTFKLGTLAPGRQQVAWDGLDDAGKPIDYPVNIPANELPAMKDPGFTQLTRPLPVNLFRIDVQAGAQVVSTNFERLAGLVDASRRCLPFMGAVRDRAGNAIVAARLAWRGRRFTPAWALDMTFPGTSSGHSSDPVETFDTAVDSHGNVYMATRNGVYKFAPDGNAADWEAKEDYINYPYPSTSRSVIGVRLDPDAKGKKTYTFGPGGGGARKTWDSAEMIDKPGFAFGWSGLAIDAGDNVYLGRTEPDPQVQVFAPSGKYLRTLPLEKGSLPYALRIGKDGALWAGCDGRLLRLNPETGAVEKNIPAAARNLHIGPDGVIYAYAGNRIARFTAAGDPLPFDKQLPTVREQGNVLMPLTRDNKMPDGADGYPTEILGLVADADGGFYISERPDTWNDKPSRLLHFAADGRFLPDLLDIKLGQRVPGNVFLDASPAVFDLFVTNLAPAATRLQVAWTLTDFDGKAIDGTAELPIAANARQVLPLAVPVAQPGHYTLAVTVKNGGQAVGSYRAQLARITSRQVYANRWSPFAICWGTDFPLMAYAGVKSQRGDNLSWGGKVEPLPGIFYSDPPDAVTYPESREGYRRYARRWGDYMLNMLDYGEGWLGGGYPNCRIFEYDRYYGYCLNEVERFSGKGEAFYQFWNEPNFFWHVPGPFSREHFGLVSRHVWSIVKARDKDALCIPDGDAGGTAMMRELAERGGAGYNDAVEFHYPGAAPITFDKIAVAGQPEGKLPMVNELIAIRDASFPGKPVWNTEEGWWGGAVKTPKMGARVIPRIYLTQMAAGVDKIYWFAQTSDDDPTYLLDGDNYPNPAYVSYATITRLLEGASYAGSIDLGKGTYGYCFIRGNEAVLAAWHVQEIRAVSIPIGVKQAVVVDLMGRERTVAAQGGKLSLTLSPDVQYVRLPYNDWARKVAAAELKRLLDGQKIANVDSLPVAINMAASLVNTDPGSLTRLLYLTRALEAAALAGLAPTVAGDPAQFAKAARAQIVKREGPDGYLRNARAMLEWTERLAAMPLPRGKAWAVKLAAQVATVIAERETPCYPGMVINAFIGTPGDIQRIRAIQPKANDLKTTVDEKFRFQLDHKPGETFEIELTARNYYRHPVTGVLQPRLPAGWQADRGIDFTLAPGAYQRYVMTVTIPTDAAPGLYPVGGSTKYQGQQVEEIYPMRIQVKE